MTAKIKSPEPEFSRPLSIDKIPDAGLFKDLEPREEERQNLAVRFGILELKSLKADLDIQPARAGQAIKVEGKLVADVVQKCVVTLDPLPAHIERNIEILYVMGDEEDDGVMEPDSIETESISNGVIDLGELVAQNFGLALDPYPRKAGVEFKGPVSNENSDNLNPMAKLAELTKKSKE